MQEPTMRFARLKLSILGQFLYLILPKYLQSNSPNCTRHVSPPSKRNAENLWTNNYETCWEHITRSINNQMKVCQILLTDLWTTSIPIFVMQNGHFFFNPHLPPPPPSSKRPFQSGKNFHHFEGPFFEVESIDLALCQYVTGAGFPPRPSQLFFNNGRVYRKIKNEINMEYVLLNC